MSDGYEYPLTISEDWREVKRFLPSDNRFIIFILKRNKIYLPVEGFVEAVRYNTMLAVGSFVRKKTVFESEAQLVNWLSKSILNAAKNEITSMNAHKQTAFKHAVRLDHPLGNSEGFISVGDYLGMSGYYDEQAAMEAEDVDIFINHIETKYGYEHSFIIREKMKGLRSFEIAKILGKAPRHIHNMNKRITKEYVRYIRRQEDTESYVSYQPIREKERADMEEEKQKNRSHLREIRSVIFGE